MLRSWPTQGLPVAWRIAWPGGYSSLAVCDGKVFTLIASNQTEVSCIALDAATGAKAWATHLGQTIHTSPYSTPTVKDGRVWVYSCQQILACLDASNGAVIWKRDMRADFGSGETDYGSSQSPWVQDGRVFVAIVAPTNAILAFDANNGSLLWQGHTNALSYGSPLGVTLHGIRQIVFPDCYGLVSVAPEDGRLLWSYPQSQLPDGRRGASPVFLGNIGVSVVAGRVSAFRVDFTNGTSLLTGLWTNNAGDTFTTLVAHNGYFFGTFRNRMRCLEPATGTVRWEAPTPDFASVVRVGDKLLALSPHGNLWQVKAIPDGYEQVASTPLRTSGDYLNSPAVSNGRIYVRDPAEIICYDARIPAPLMLYARPSSNPDRLLLSVGCNDYSPLQANRVSRIKVFLSDTLQRPLSNWWQFASPLVYTNGCLTCELPIVKSGPTRFYTAVE